MRPPPKEAEYVQLRRRLGVPPARFNEAASQRGGILEKPGARSARETRFNEAASQRGGIRGASEPGRPPARTASMRPPPKEAEYPPRTGGESKMIKASMRPPPKEAEYNRADTEERPGDHTLQ